ncbi:MAG: hypothetical protein AAGA23_24005 [Pseudomonadota bacterium]
MKQVVPVILALLIATPALACDGEAWIELRVIPSELAGIQVVEATSIDQEGCVESRFAEFDRRAGTYERYLDPDQYDALQAQLPGLIGFNTAATEQILRQPPPSDGVADVIGPTLLHVGGGDVYRLTIHNGAATKDITWRAPRAMASARSDVTALVDLVQFFDTLRDAAADPRKADVQEVQR